MRPPLYVFTRKVLDISQCGAGSKVGCDQEWHETSTCKIKTSLVNDLVFYQQWAGTLVPCSAGEGLKCLVHLPFTTDFVNDKYRRLETALETVLRGKAGQTAMRPSEEPEMNTVYDYKKKSGCLACKAVGGVRLPLLKLETRPCPSLLVSFARGQI